MSRLKSTLAERPLAQRAAMSIWRARKLRNIRERLASCPADAMEDCQGQLRDFDLKHLDTSPPGLLQVLPSLGLAGAPSKVESGAIPIVSVMFCDPENTLQGDVVRTAKNPSVPVIGKSRVMTPPVPVTVARSCH